MIIEPFLESISEKCKANGIEGTYIDSNGVLRCTVCNEPRQTVTRFSGQEKTVYCACSCQQKREADAKAQRLEADTQRQNEALKETAIPCREQREITFETAVNPNEKHILIAKWYVENWEEHKRNGTGLVFCGNVGTGKTFAALCIANALVKKGVKVKMTDFSYIINTLTSNTTQDKNAVIESFTTCDLLIVDDMGAEYHSDYTLQYIEQVMNGCYKNNTPFILTTNTSVAEMKQPQNIKYSRIYSRILGKAIPVAVIGNDRRAKQGEELMKKALASIEKYINEKNLKT
ncbi:MAG: ATP-binding protein [Oscillospiraceae bacterium]|nr:ATP-binding protein [Oscillospiraceae bacterium]